MAVEVEANMKVSKTSTVLPTSYRNIERPACPLITFDLPYITFYYNQKVLLYKSSSNGEEEEFESIVGRMKEGLGEVLEYFYPLAGRIAKDEEGVLVVKCDGDVGEGMLGVEVIEALAEAMTVDDLAEGEATALLQDLVPYSNVMNLEGFRRPLLSVQVLTRHKWMVKILKPQATYI